MGNHVVKMGVFGVGSLGQHHARNYNELAETELVGVYDADTKRAREIAKANNTRAFESMDKLAGEIEAASVAVPTDLHREVAGHLLEKGLHLLVEKPLAATTREAEELVGLANQHQCILQVGHIERFNPAFTSLEKITKNPRFIEAHRLAPYPPPRPGMKPRGTEVSVVLDLMIHDLEIILHLVQSPVKSIHAVGVDVLSPTEDIANVRLAFENGCVANITASRISPEPMRKIRVFFEEAYISLDYQSQSGEIYRKKLLGIGKDKVPVQKGEPLANELKSFAQCVATKDEPKVSGEHAAHALRLAVQIIQQIAEGAS
jgi:predicted dehydrogenase